MFVGKILLQHELQLPEVIPARDAFGGFPDSVGRENTAENEKDCKHDSGAEQIPAARFVKDGQNKISEHPDQQPCEGDAVDDEILCFFFGEIAVHCDVQQNERQEFEHPDYRSQFRFILSGMF